MPLAASIALWGQPVVFAQDADLDGVVDATESVLLSTLSPVFRARDFTQRPPLPLSWYIRHCRLVWFNGSQRVGDTGGTEFSLDSALAFVEANPGRDYRLEFRDPMWRNGQDPADPMNIGTAQIVGALYGRVHPTGPGSYQVQYFMPFGYNSVDGAPGCPLGNHEGDWICVDLSVYAPDPAAPAITDAILHNHGRQIFVEAGNVFSYQDGTHPVIFLEIGSQEPWPFGSYGGFFPPTCNGDGWIAPPPGVTTNYVFMRAARAFGSNIGGEHDGYQVSREHTGEGWSYYSTTVVNVGEIGRPYPTPESRFFQGFPGWYGTSHESSCYWGLGPELDVTCPPSPRFQTKMWERDYGPRGTYRRWGWWSLSCNVRWVDFLDSSGGDGGFYDPISAAGFAAAVNAAPNGTVFATRGGHHAGPLTIFKPCTIVNEYPVAEDGSPNPTTFGR